MTDDELDTAALRNLPQSVKRGSSVLQFQLGYGSEDALNAQRDAIREYRQRVAALTDKRTRKAYEHWLDFFQQENDEARQEMLTGVRRKAWLLHKAKQEDERSRIRRNQEAIGKP